MGLSIRGPQPFLVTRGGIDVIGKSFTSEKVYPLCDYSVSFSTSRRESRTFVTDYSGVFGLEVVCHGSLLLSLLLFHRYFNSPL